ncbi:hypothetical protein ACVME8_002075 [Bradyrhizobium diazoefficiens]
MDRELLALLYSKYNPIEDIDSFVAAGLEIFPNLNCGLASVYLQHLIPEGSIVQGSYQSDPHTFLLLEHGLILDITADQCGGPPVYVGGLQPPWSRQVLRSRQAGFRPCSDNFSLKARQADGA